jgi:CRP-like cAMP-binding protein
MTSLGISGPFKLPLPCQNFSMALHPAEISKEISKYRFFAGFEQSLLLQLCTMIREIDIPANSKILSEGQINSSLYFLRSGEVDVTIAGEKVMTIFIPGEVLGEMSVLNTTAATATVIARTDVKCFAINSEDFSHVHPGQKDRFNYLLFRIYSLVLAERLAKTNEKARMFEQTARELDHAKRELQALTNSQMSFLKKEAQSTSQKTKVLFWDPNKVNHPVAKMTIGGTGVSLQLTSEEAQAVEVIEKQNPSIVFAELESLIKASSLKADFSKLVAMSQQKLNFDLVKKLEPIRFLITRDPQDRVFNIKSLLSTLSKILNKDFFGIDKYLSIDAEIKNLKVMRSQDREQLSQTVLEDFRSLGIRSSILDRCQVAIEEMLMNSIYDAPTDSTGKSIYNHMTRKQEIQLKESEYSDLNYGCDGLFAAVSVRDPFGALKKETILDYLHTNYQGTADNKREGKGGAGRGLHQIIESSDLTIFNIQKGKATEVICLWSIESAIQKREIIPSFHLFLIE